MLTIVLSLAACTKPPERAQPVKRGPSTPTALEEAVRQVAHQPPCFHAIPMEWSAARPVPLDDPHGRLFKLLFYPVSAPGADFGISTPGAEAVIDLTSGKAVSCKLLGVAPQPLSHRRWSQAADGLGMMDFEEREHQLYGLTESVAAAYNSGRAPEISDPALANNFRDAFLLLAEPDLLPYYYRSNPAFWEWLRKTTGKSIPAAP